MSRIAAFLLVLVLAMAGCGTGDETPRAVINGEIGSAIETAGGETTDWVFDNDCVINGSCTATIAVASFPSRILATNRYVARDSRAFLKGRDVIATAVNRAYSRQCLERFTRPESLIRCLR
ncbi:MAG: hypothetical protein KDB54_12350 [Solirubrobacterales bacterium]|nr:hypothetical protein [Solirubrobacterales bacterium]HRV61172.1 hypothetical protein [Solirubrobacterales bacterium]